MNQDIQTRETSKTEELSEKLLSICLLTYNQANDIERLLTSLASQVTDDVEIIIRDDSTNDATERIVERFSKIVPIRYYHGTKEGVDKTLIFVTKVARGRFVWWMGDDDVVPGGVSSVLDVIKQKTEVTFIWANYRLVNGKKLAIDFPENCFFDNRDQLLVLGGAALGFISATIFKRELSLLGIDLAKKYIGSAFVSLYLVLFVISQPGKHYYIRGEVVICHPATSDEAKASVVSENGVIDNWAFQVFGINFAKIVRDFSNTFSATAIRRTIKTSFGQTWRGILVAYVGGWDTPKGKRIQMIKYFWMYPECWIALVLFMIPKSILSVLYSLYKSLYRR
jgi:glycosyltransferase involved in cell wall biosynthesis